jgi:hypothetical protein
LQIEYLPIAVLNRTFALSKTNGRQQAIFEAEKLPNFGELASKLVAFFWMQFII